MNFIGQMLIYLGFVAAVLGNLGISFCAFSLGIGRGLVSLVFPFIGFGVAMRRFPWLVWMWAGGIACIVIGALFV